MKKLLITLGFLLPSLAWGATILFPTGGGTGWDNLQGGSVLFGNWTGKIATSSVFSYATTTNTLSVQDLLVNGVCTGCGGSGVFDWTPTADGNSTSTRLIFGNGFISNASSSVQSLQVAGAFNASSTSFFNKLLTFGNASGTQLTTTNSAYLATMGGNVGIGTTSPSTKLDVIGTASIDPASKNYGLIKIEGATGISALTLSDSEANSVGFHFVSLNSAAGGATTGTFKIINFVDAAANLDRLIINDIGMSISATTAPSPINLFDVQGNAAIGAGYAGVNTAPDNGLIVQGNVGIGTTSPWGLLSINPNALGAGVPSFVIGSSTATSFIVDNGGRVGIGTTNPSTELEVNGTTTATSYTDATGDVLGAWHLIETQTITSSTSTVDFTTGIDSTYDSYVLVGSLVVPVNDAVAANIQVHSGGAWKTANYQSAVRSHDSDGGLGIVGSNSNGGAVTMANSVGSATGEAISFTLTLHNPSNTAIYKHIDGSSTWDQSSGNTVHTLFGGSWKAGTGAVDGIRMLFGSGNIESGKFSLYGVKN